MIKVAKIRAKSAFGCHYCYASFAGRFVGEPIGNRGARTDEHRRALDAIVAKLLTKHGLSLRLERVIYHHEPDGPEAVLRPRQ